MLQTLKDNVERAMQSKPVLDRKGEPTGEYVYDGAVANRGLELLGRHLSLFPEHGAGGVTVPVQVNFIVGKGYGAPGIEGARVVEGEVPR